MTDFLEHSPIVKQSMTVYLIVNPTKYIQDLYAENHKILMREIKEDTE